MIDDAVLEDLTIITNHTMLQMMQIWLILLSAPTNCLYFHLRQTILSISSMILVIHMQMQLITRRSSNSGSHHGRQKIQITKEFIQRSDCEKRQRRSPSPSPCNSSWKMKVNMFQYELADKIWPTKVLDVTLSVGLA